MSELPIYGGNLSAANLNWIGVSYSIKALYLQARDYFASKDLSQIVDEITEKSVAKTSVYYDLTDSQIGDLRHDVAAYLRGLRIPTLMRSFRAEYPVVNRIINRDEGWESSLGTGPTSAKLARAFKRVIGDGSIEQTVVEAQSQGDTSAIAKFREWKREKNTSQMVADVVTVSASEASNFVTRFGAFPELALGDSLKNEFKKILSPLPIPSLQSAGSSASEDEDISQSDLLNRAIQSRSITVTAPVTPRRATTSLAKGLRRGAAGRKLSHSVGQPSADSTVTTVLKRPVVRKQATIQTLLTDPDKPDHDTVIVEKPTKKRPLPATTINPQEEEPAVQTPPIPVAVIPSVAATPAQSNPVAVVSPAKPKPRYRVVVLAPVITRPLLGVPPAQPKPVQRVAPETAPVVVPAEQQNPEPSSLVQQELDGDCQIDLVAHPVMVREENEIQVSRDLVRVASLPGIVCSDTTIIDFAKYKISNSARLESADVQAAMAADWGSVLSEIKQRRMYEIPPEDLGKLVTSDVETDIAYLAAARIVMNSNRVLDCLTRLAKKLQDEFRDIIPVSVSGVYNLLFDNPVHYTRIVKDKSIKIFNYIREENQRLMPIARSNADLEYSPEDIGRGMPELLREAAQNMGYPEQVEINADLFTSPVIKFQKLISELTRDDVLLTLTQNIRPLRKARP
jgi:hypothetical protein